MGKMHLDCGGITACGRSLTRTVRKPAHACDARELVTCGSCRRADEWAAWDATVRELEALLLAKAIAHAEAVP